VPLSDVDLRFTLTVPKNTHQFGHPKNNIRVQQHLLTQEKKKNYPSTIQIRKSVKNIADLKHPNGVELCSKRCWDKLTTIKKRISYARVCVEVEASEELVKDFYLQCESLGIPLFRVLLQIKTTSVLW
jgi:hypothetical protein